MYIRIHIYATIWYGGKMAYLLIYFLLIVCNFYLSFTNNLGTQGICLVDVFCEAR